MRGYRRAHARLRFAKLSRELGREHPATRAAFGRMLVYGGDGYPAAVPQRNATSIEAIAWHRESAQPGYWNRARRSV